MNHKPEDLESMGYVLLDKLAHNELVPFIRTYMKKRTAYSVFYYACNFILLALTAYFVVRGYSSPQYQLDERISHLSYGLAIAFLLVPLHEYIHVLAYKSQGAFHTSYDANLKKFYFMALADKFVANKKEFEVVALAPFVVISALFILLLFLAPAIWTVTISSALLAHTAMCSGDFGLLSYMDFHKQQSPVTYDDVANKISYFYGKPDDIVSPQLIKK